MQKAAVLPLRQTSCPCENQKPIQLQRIVLTRVGSTRASVKEHHQKPLEQSCAQRAELQTHAPKDRVRKHASQASMILESEGQQGNLQAQNPYRKEEQAEVSRKRRLRADIGLRTESSLRGRQS